MTRENSTTDDTGSEQKTRRDAIGTLAGSAVIVAAGAYGVSRLSETATAQASFQFFDHAVALEPDEELERIEIQGIVEGTYERGSEAIESAALTVTIEDEAGEGLRVTETDEFGDIDPEGGTVTTEFSHVFENVPRTIAGPDSGETLETVFQTNIDFELVGESGSIVGEASASDSATFSVERKRADPEPYEFLVTAMDPQHVTVTRGEPFDIAVTVRNEGTGTGTDFLWMEADLGTAVEEIELDAGEETTVEFENFTTGGFETGEQPLYVYTIHDSMEGTLTIEDDDENEDETESATGTTQGELEFTTEVTPGESE